MTKQAHTSAGGGSQNQPGTDPDVAACESKLQELKASEPGHTRSAGVGAQGGFITNPLVLALFEMMLALLKKQQPTP